MKSRIFATILVALALFPSLPSTAQTTNPYAPQPQIQAPSTQSKPQAGVQRKYQCANDPDCVSRLRVYVEDFPSFSGDLASLERKLVEEFGRNLDWLMVILEQAVPAPKIKAFCSEANDVNGWITHNAKVVGTDGRFLPTADATTTNSLKLALDTFSRFSVPEAVPIDAADVCMDVGPLAEELGLGRLGAIRVRVPVKALENLTEPDFRHTRRGFVTLEDGNGVALAESKFDWPGLVELKKHPVRRATTPGSNGSDCHLTITVKPKRNYDQTHKLGPLSSLQAAKGASVELRMSAPGQLLEKRMEVVARAAVTVAMASEDPSKKKVVLDTRRYTQLIRAAFASKITVEEKSVEPNTVGLKLGIQGADKDSLKDVKALAAGLVTRRSNDKFGGDVCLADAKGTEIGRFAAGRGQLSQFEGTLDGIDQITTRVILDAKKAGIGQFGAIEVKMPEDDKKKLYRLVASNPGAAFVARLEKKPEIERTAFVELPVEKGKPLRVKVQLSPALAITPADRLLITGAGFSFTAQLAAFPDHETLMESLLTNYGVPKDARFNASAFSVVRDSVRVAYHPGSFRLFVVAQDVLGRLIASRDESFPMQLIAEKPLTGKCALVLKPPPEAGSRDVTFGDLEIWETEQFTDAKVIDRDAMDVKFMYKVPAPCGPAK